MHAVALTDIGRQRLMNQDCIYASSTPVGPLPDLFIVADGMGGEKAGDYASKSLVSYMLSSLQTTMKTPVAAVREAIEFANTSLYAESQANPNLAGMGTTVVAATIVDSVLYTFNVGDSRLYIIRETENEVQQITKDHSYVEMLVSYGVIDRESEEYKKNKAKITRAVGTEEEILVDCFETELDGSEKILLCSDGLTNMVDNEIILKIIKSGASLEASARRLVEEANLNGGRNNISLVLIENDMRW